MPIIGTTFALAAWLLAVFVSVLVFAVPGTVSGNVNWLAAIVGISCLLAGPWIHGRRCDCQPLFFIYGCIGGSLFLPLHLPDSRDLLRQAMNPNPHQTVWDWVFTITCIIGVVVAGIICRSIAASSFAQEEYQAIASERCPTCGYLKYGLPEPRCPECGTPFQPVKRRCPADEHGQSE